MGKVSTYLHALNVGQIDAEKLARVDLERMRLAAEEQTNFLCDTVGKMVLRPGFGYIAGVRSNLRSMLKSFVFSANDAALFEFTASTLRVLVDDVVLTRPSVTSTVADGTFSALTGWTDISTTGATATATGGYLCLTASAKGSLAGVRQQVSTSSANIEHALRIVVERGPVVFRCGSSSGGDQYISETTLRTGTHSLAFTPTGSYWLQIQSDEPVLKRVDSISVEAAGIVTLPTPWPLDDLHKLKFTQSGDVVFIACDGYQQRRIERRSDRSWSIVLYTSDDGPFTAIRTANVRLKPAALQGNTTLTADKSFFTADHVGALFRLDGQGQRVTQSLAAEDVYTDPIRVTGVKTSNYNDRNWSYTITGTWVGTINVSRSFDDEDAGYMTFRRESGSATTDITANASYSNDDADNNAIVYYRIGFEPGNYTSGTATIAVRYDGGGDYGICRVTAYNSATSVDVEVLRPFTSLKYTSDWREGEWSAQRGWPAGVAMYDGRLWWGGRDKFWGSVSDAFESFDEEVEGDAGPILRSIATGGVNQINSILPLQRLLFLTEGTETSARSSSFDEPLTPTNLTLRDASTRGSANTEPVKVDSRGLFADRSSRILLETVMDPDANDYVTSELSKLSGNLFSSGIRQMAVQRRPDTRVWVVCEDGSLVCIVYEPSQQVIAFIPIATATGDTFDSVAVLPGTAQDIVYVAANRTVNAATVRYIEKMALDSEITPGTTCKVMDSFIASTNSPASVTVSGLSHLQGRSVVVWADGAPVSGSYTVSSTGTITLSSEVTSYVVGLGYRGRYKSARLAYGAAGGTSMLKDKRVEGLGLILTDFHYDGLRYGPTFDSMYPLPPTVDFAVPSDVYNGSVFEDSILSFGGDWSTDSRVCLECSSPYPVKVLGLVMDVATNG
jgi:hypothetical protein